MLPYWILFVMVAVGASLERIQLHTLHRYRLPLVLVMIVLVLMIGLRYDVGGDWQTYEMLFDYAGRRSLETALQRGDIGYQALSHILSKGGAEIWVLNVFCACIFAWGLVELARNQPAPLLAILVAIPYLVVVVAMGYTRQAVAIGFIMAGLAAVERGKGVLQLSIYVLFAVMFHRTAVIALPVVMLAGNRNYLISLLAGALVTYGLYSAFLSGSVDVYVSNYLDTGYQSQGAAIRVAMNVVPALLMIFFGRQLQFGEYQFRLWRIVAWVAVALVPALLVSTSSTAIDRLALYVLPIQMVVLPRAVMLFRNIKVGKAVVMTYAAAVLAVWLLFAEHSRYWLPYQAYGVSDTKAFQPGSERYR